MAQVLNDLINRRGVIKAQLTRFANFLETIQDDQKPEIQSRLEKIEQVWKEFDNIQSQIEVLDLDELNKPTRENFEDKFFKYVSVAKQYVQNESGLANSIVSSGSIVSNNISTTISDINTPELELQKFSLPKFHGDYDKWFKFKNTFESLIVKNAKFDSAQKLYRLQECVVGDAEKVIEGIESFDEAWALLVERFEDKPGMIQKHIKDLIDLSRIPTESVALLRKFLDDINRHLRALKALGEPTDSWDRLLILLMSRKLDDGTRDVWEQTRIVKHKGIPKFKDFIDFVLERCKSLEAKSEKFRFSDNRSNNSKQQFRSNHSKNISTSHLVTQSSGKCEYCKGQHYIYFCKKFIELPISSRKTEIKRLKLCTNCLRNSHFVADCRSSGCKICKNKHNSLLHEEEKQAPTNIEKDGGEVNALTSAISHFGSNKGDITQTKIHHDFAENVGSVNLHCNSNNGKAHKTHVFLSTAVVLIADSHGKFHEARCLLDNGSQPSFITKELFEKLELLSERINLPVLGVNQKQSNIKIRTQTTIKSCHNNFSIAISFLVLDKITANIPSQTIHSLNLNIPDNLTLADPQFARSSKIDILLGAEVFFDLMCAGQIKLGPNLPTLQKTVLGWIVSGPFHITGKSDNLCHLALVDQNLDEKIEEFWKVEEFTASKPRSLEEEKCDQIFIETTRRNEAGRFVVTLPLRDNIKDLGNSLDIAKKRLLSVERKFRKNPVFKEIYVNFMREYQSLGHMTKLTDTTDNKTNQVYYLPHHGVINEGSLTTKLRVVFDGSAKPSSGLALNDVLMVGPCIQDDLFTILCRFRQHKYAITSDINKHYRQIEVSENHRNLQRIIWRENEADEIQHFSLNTITYGLGPSSFIATRCLKQIADDIRFELPNIGEIIEHDFYIDDLNTGSETVSEAIFIAKTVAQTLSSYGFPLRKWNSNCREILTHIVEPDLVNSGHFLTNNDCSKILGIFWRTSTDELEYVINLPDCGRKVTKRIILSTISQIFDPLGLVGPVIVFAKILMQKLWQLRIGWDESLPLNIISSWQAFRDQLSVLNSIKIPRVLGFNTDRVLELHGFSDASEKAFGACIYVKSVSSDNVVAIRLLAAKSRVAPLKSISLPRLELCGALLLAKLMQKVSNSFRQTQVAKHYWCDSTIVLFWLAREPNTWKPFVGNRVSEIISLTDLEQWRYVESKQNPADVISRGTMPNSLLSELLWWQGPQFLYNTHTYPIYIATDTSEENPILEKRKVKEISLVVNEINFSIFDKFSSLKKLTRVVAWALRFCSNARKAENDRNFAKYLDATELKLSLQGLVHWVQRSEYPKEMKALSDNKEISVKSKLKSLNPFYEEKMLRVGGRLKRANLDFGTKFPIILPPKNRLTRLIIEDEHVRQLHSGPLATLAAVRNTFWPIHGRKEVRGVLSKCIVCFKNRPQPLQQKMADLPADRVTPVRPFYVCGTDFAGPFLVKDGKLRNRAIIKSYMCIFVCFTTKAVHIEIVSDLTSDSFLNCFKRFVSRRGLCRKIYSDNGKNYVGAYNQIKGFLTTLDQDESFHNFCSQNQISWHFNPAMSPHQGGLWEAAIKSAKYHATRIIGNQHLTFEELGTIFTQIEAVLNSRPLTELSSEPNDLNPLTPGHFLIGSPLTLLPESDLREYPDHRLRRYELLSKMFQHFWARWKNDYLHNLQQRTKWQSTSSNIKIGTLVMLKEDNTSPLCWRMGRVTELHPGEDDLVRVVSVKTNNGVLKRAVQKLCPLPQD